MPPTSKEPTCELCRRWPLPLQRLRYLWDYQYEASYLIKAMKYQGAVRLANWCGNELGGHLAELFALPDWTMIVPMQTTWNSYLKRGFSQCHEIAASLAKRIHKSALVQQPLRFNLRRVAQAKRAPAERLKKGLILPQVRRSLEGERVLIIDDVITTGATVGATAQAMLKAGASSVDAVVLAASPTWCNSRAGLAQRLSRL